LCIKKELHVGPELAGVISCYNYNHHIFWIGGIPAVLAMGKWGSNQTESTHCFNRLQPLDSLSLFYPPFIFFVLSRSGKDEQKASP
jgi:hypothetical protein